MTYNDLKKECLEANMRLWKDGLVLHTFGNASRVDRSMGVFAIKPSGAPYESLKWRDIVVVGLDGAVVDGDLRPSSDSPTHAVLYREFPGVGGIAHTHSTNAVAWAQAGRPVPVYGTTHADHLARPVPCAGFMPDERVEAAYESETGLHIVECLRSGGLDPSEVPMILVAGHGPFTWGRDAMEAARNAAVLEELCRTAMLTEALNPSARPLREALVRKHYERKHGKDAYYGQSQI